MLDKLLKNLEKESVVSFYDGVYLVRVGKTLDFSCTEVNGILRFESTVTSIPSDEGNRMDLLNSLLQRSARMARFRQEGICVDSEGELVLLQHTIPLIHVPVSDLVVAFRDFIRALDAWRTLAGKFRQCSLVTC